MMPLDTCHFAPPAWLFFTAVLSASLACAEPGWDPGTTFPPLPPAEAIKTIDEVPLGCRTLCTTCHGPDGKGVKLGDKFLAPPFEASAWFRNGGNVEVLGRIRKDIATRATSWTHEELLKLASPEPPKQFHP